MESLAIRMEASSDQATSHCLQLILRPTPDSRAPAQHRAKVGRYRGDRSKRHEAGAGRRASRQHHSMWKGAERPGVCIFLSFFPSLSPSPSLSLSQCLSVSLSLSLSFSLSPLSVSVSVCVRLCLLCLLCLSLSLSLSLSETVWGLCCHILRLSWPI